ncbi:hypothetical protein GCM10027413_21600 [Conyzicola nivalis]|uniref:EcsC family protein n=1 Tax=Conyzicola nivalis TaxID=1477021 RepID=A0A916WFU6_9MICO|nr:hypothetical protein [Conyzicola nivalis]GGA93452.1 hypothetical protein GCM10010979_05020 [Conyzicola nivalis]
MSIDSDVAPPESKFNAVLTAASGLPGVRIHREAYLRRALARYCSDEQVQKAVNESPAAAGIPSNVIDKAAMDSIKYETAKVTGLSAAAGIPGGFALVGTVPADFAQNFAHVLRIAQKLAYLYSWPNLFAADGEEPDDATKGMLTLFVGVMFGAQAANQGVTAVAGMLAKEALRKLPQQALTKGVIYPIVKEVSKKLGAEMTKLVFAKGMAKVIPIVGAVLNGGVTLATYAPMSLRLKKHLASLELTKPHAEPAS